MNKIPYNLGETAITVILDCQPYTLNSDHPNFKLLRQALLDGEYDKVKDLVSTKQAVETLSQGKIKVENGQVLYGNHVLTGVVVDKLLGFLKQGMKDAQPIINFIERLMANPSSNSVQELYTFLGYKNLPLTEEGMVLGYKGVNPDYWSVRGNTQTIVVQGKTNSSGQILNEVGATIEVARNCVDDNKNNHCSQGLHIGSLSYAKGWAGNGKLLLVEFDPADAVSVPTDHEFQKLRVSKYKVIADITDNAKKEIVAEVVEESDSFEDDSDIYEEEYCDETIDEEYDAEALAARNKIENYIENRHEEEVEPTLKAIQSRMKGVKLSCQEIKRIVEEDIGYEVQSDDDVALSQSVVLFWEEE